MTKLFDGIQTMHRALDYHLERQNILSSNVANIDVPGFRPMELTRTLPPEPGRFPQPGRFLQLVQTSAAHVGNAGLSRAEAVGVAEDRTVQPGADGNAVSLERELSKLAANDLQYESIARMVNQRLAMLRYVSNDGVG